MSEITVSDIKKRSISGVIAFTVRTIALYIISLVATALLAAFLSVEDYGIFFVVSSLINLFTFISDIGLAASLIQKKQTPSADDLTTTFTVQQLLGVIIFGLIVGLTPFWRQYYGLSPSGLYLLYALGGSFILASFKTIPSILLERKLDFNRLIIPQIVENIVFYSSAVFLAWKGYGVTSYTVAVILRAVTGIVVIYLLQSWRLGLKISRQSLKELLGFGFPFQINDLLARIKDDFLIVILKKILTDAEMGYIGLTKQLSFFPFNFSVQNVIRVTFPAYARLQHDQKLLQKAIEKSLFFVAFLIFPLLAGMAGLAYPITQVVTKYHKWQPALPALYLFLVNIGWSAISSPLTNALNAIGKIKITLKLMIFWTTLTWVLTIPLVIKIGFLGVPLAAALVATTSVVTIVIMQRIIPLKVVNHIWPQLLASLVMMVSLIKLKYFFLQSVGHVIVGIGIGATIYLTLVTILLNRRLIAEIRTIIKYQKS